MGEIIYNKLIRDNIPEIIESQGKTVVTRVLTDSEYQLYLNRKLQEEISEYIGDNCINEICDILEVIDAICANMGISKEALKEAKKMKADKNGAFVKKLCLEKVIDNK